MWVWPKSGPKSEVIGENLISLISLVPAAWAPAGIMEFVSNSREVNLIIMMVVMVVITIANHKTNCWTFYNFELSSKGEYDHNIKYLNNHMYLYN